MRRPNLPPAPAAKTAGASRSDQTHCLVIDQVTHRYLSKGVQVHALSDVNLVIEPGEFVCVAGPSGCGKTTLLQLLAGFLRPTEGVITIDNQQIQAPGPERGVVFQQPSLFPWLTVLGNVEAGPRLRGVDKSTRRADAHRYLEMVGLLDVAHRRPYELSGGMQQRCQLARALANDPQIMLMDEPFGALDALTRERLQLELLNIWSETRKTIFFITHSVEEAVFLGSRVIVMSAQPGRIVFDELVNLPGAVDGRPGTKLRTAPEFSALRDRVNHKIYESGG